jgi:hypothetical protein
MKKNKCAVKLLAVFLILMLAVNAAVLHFCFDIHISDLAGFIAGNNGDGSAENGGGDSSVEMLTLGREDPGRMRDDPAENEDGDGSSNRGITERDGRSGFSGSDAAKAGADGSGTAETGTAGNSASAGEFDQGNSRGDGTIDTVDPGGSSPMPADAMEVMKNLSFSDKIFLLGIFARIGKSEMEEILNMVQDGVDAWEMEKLKAYADDYLGPSDIARLEDMLARYGHIYAETGK